MEDSSTFLISSALRGIVDEATLLTSSNTREEIDSTKFLENDLLLTITTEHMSYYYEVVEINILNKTIKINTTAAALNTFLSSELATSAIQCSLIINKKEDVLASLAVELLSIHKSAQREFIYTLKIITT